MPIKWALNNTKKAIAFFLERLETLLLPTAQGRALGCHLLGKKMRGRRGLSPSIEVSHLRAEDYFCYHWSSARHVFFAMMVAVPATLGAFRFEEVSQENSSDSSVWKAESCIHFTVLGLIQLAVATPLNTSCPEN